MAFSNSFEMWPSQTLCASGMHTGLKDHRIDITPPSGVSIATSDTDSMVTDDSSVDSDGDTVVSLTESATGGTVACGDDLVITSIEGSTPSRLGHQRVGPAPTRFTTHGLDDLDSGSYTEQMLTDSLLLARRIGYNPRVPYSQPSLTQVPHGLHQPKSQRSLAPAVGVTGGDNQIHVMVPSPASAPLSGPTTALVNISTYSPDGHGCRCACHFWPLALGSYRQALADTYYSRSHVDNFVHSVFVDALFSSPPSCRVDAATLSADAQLVSYAMFPSESSDGNSARDYAPFVESILATRSAPVTEFGPGYCYLLAVRTKLRYRVARILGPCPYICDLLALLPIVGAAKMAPYTLSQSHIPGSGHMIHLKARSDITPAPTSEVADQLWSDLCMFSGRTDEGLARIGAFGFGGRSPKQIRNTPTLSNSDVQFFNAHLYAVNFEFSRLPFGAPTLSLQPPAGSYALVARYIRHDATTLDLAKPELAVFFSESSRASPTLQSELSAAEDHYSEIARDPSRAWLYNRAGRLFDGMTSDQVSSLPVVSYDQRSGYVTYLHPGEYTPLLGVRAMVVPACGGKSTALSRAPAGLLLFEADQLCDVKTVPRLAELRHLARLSGDWLEFNSEWARSLMAAAPPSSVVMVPDADVAHAMGVAVIAVVLPKLEVWSSSLAAREFTSVGPVDHTKLDRYRFCYDRAAASLAAVVCDTMDLTVDTIVRLAIEATSYSCTDVPALLGPLPPFRPLRSNKSGMPVVAEPYAYAYLVGEVIVNGSGSRVSRIPELGVFLLDGGRTSFVLVSDLSSYEDHCLRVRNLSVANDCRLAFGFLSAFRSDTHGAVPRLVSSRPAASFFYD